MTGNRPRSTPMRLRRRTLIRVCPLLIGGAILRTSALLLGGAVFTVATVWLDELAARPRSFDAAYLERIREEYKQSLKRNPSPAILERMRWPCWVFVGIAGDIIIVNDQPENDCNQW